ncbi:hypothetical protein IWQ61_005626 [Dispira simplex]|nr:hypothetical protein IWQ61_005626 [Dispira simplex]
MSGPLLQRLCQVTAARRVVLRTTNMGHLAGLLGTLGTHTPCRLASVVTSANGKQRPGSGFSASGHHPGAQRDRRLKVYYNQLSPELRYILFSDNPSVVKESKQTKSRTSGSSTAGTSVSSRSAPRATDQLRTSNGHVSDKAYVEQYMKEIDGLVQQCQATVQVLQSTLKQRQQRQVMLEHRLDQTKADNVRQATLVSQLTHKLQRQHRNRPPSSILSGSSLTESKKSLDKKVVGCARVSDHYDGGAPRQPKHPSTAVPLRTSSTAASPTPVMPPKDSISVASRTLERPLVTSHVLNSKWVWVITVATSTATLGLVFSDSIVVLV